MYSLEVAAVGKGKHNEARLYSVRKWDKSYNIIVFLEFRKMDIMNFKLIEVASCAGLLSSLKKIKMANPPTS